MTAPIWWWTSVYRGGPQPNWAADPLGRLLPVGLQGGIRVAGGQRAPRLVALATSGANLDWPDTIDAATGTVTYYGDNRHPGSDLYDTPKGGNRVLRATSTGPTPRPRRVTRCRPISCSLRPGGAVTSGSVGSWPPALPSSLLMKTWSRSGAASTACGFRTIELSSRFWISLPPPAPGLTTSSRATRYQLTAQAHGATGSQVADTRLLPQPGSSIGPGRSSRP